MFEAEELFYRHPVVQYTYTQYTVHTYTTYLLVYVILSFTEYIFIIYMDTIIPTCIYLLQRMNALHIMLYRSIPIAVIDV